MSARGTYLGLQPDPDAPGGVLVLRNDASGSTRASELPASTEALRALAREATDAGKPGDALAILGYALDVEQARRRLARFDAPEKS